MIERKVLETLVEGELVNGGGIGDGGTGDGGTGDGELFLVDLSIGAGGDIEIVVDSDTRVSIDQCATLSRSVERSMEARWGESIMEQYSIVVMSAGIGYPLTHPRQLQKCLGREVSIVMKDGAKLAGTLTEYSEEAITITYEEKVSVEGKKRKELVEQERKIELADTKSVSEQLTIK